MIDSQVRQWHHLFKDEFLMNVHDEERNGHLMVITDDLVNQVYKNHQFTVLEF